MTWFAAGAAAITVATTYMGAQSNASNAIKNANSASRAEGEQIYKERLNQTIRNSYSTSLAQLQLGLKKRQLAGQAADIRASSLAAGGDAQLGISSTSSIGRSTNAVVSDIAQKTQQALDMTTDQFENELDNYNRELQMMVINTEQSAPTVRKNEYIGPSDGDMFGMALMQGASSFAGNYAMRKMSLGAGDRPSSGGNGMGGGTGLQPNQRSGLSSMGGGTGLYIR